MITKSFYNIFHSSSSSSFQIPDKNDFTYKTIINITEKYLNKPSKIVDIGCGVGLVDFYLSRKGHIVKGFDISEKAINIAINTVKNVKLICYPKFGVLDFSKNIPTGKYNVVLCSEVLEHLKNDTQAVKNIYKLLNKKGLVIASSPSINSPLFRLGVLSDFDNKVGHLRRYSVDSFVELFKINKFKILEIIKTEGIIRNYLYTNKFGGILLRILKRWPISDIVTILDNITIPIFGESNIYIVAQKVK